MLNTTIKYSPTQNILFDMPAVCSGTLQKSRACSRFKRFHYKSEMADYMFPTDGSPSRLGEVKNIYGNIDEEKTNARYPEVEILQIMCFGDGELLVEYAYKKDLYEEEGLGECES